MLRRAIACLLPVLLTTPGMGLFMKIVSYLSFCRWGMVALFSIELAPWYYGDPTMNSCCKP